jgi:hypothetical protein
MGKVIPCLISYKSIFYMKIFNLDKTSFWSNQIVFSLEICFKLKSHCSLGPGPASSFARPAHAHRPAPLLMRQTPDRSPPPPAACPCLLQTPPGPVPLPSSFLCMASPAPDPPPLFLRRCRPSLLLFFPLRYKPLTVAPGATLRHRPAPASELATMGSHGRSPHPHARVIWCFSGREPLSASAFFPFTVSAPSERLSLQIAAALSLPYTPPAATEPHRDPHRPPMPPPPSDAIMPKRHRCFPPQRAPHPRFFSTFGLGLTAV